MSEQTGSKPDAKTGPEADAPEGAAPATPSADNQNAADTAKLAAENADLKDRLLRTLAEIENVRRRTRIEVDDARTYSVNRFATEILSIGDSLQRTLDALPKEGAEAESPVVKALVEGVAVTAREFLKVLGKFNIRRLEPLGERFDPHFHQAMYEVPSPDVPTGTVVEVMQDGYAIGDRTLRPALVAVSKGGPRQSPMPTANRSAQEPSTSPEQPGSPEQSTEPPSA
jgi:molecular chaperone GrpE